MNSLLTRVVSALIAVVGLFSLFYFFRERGIHFLIYFTVILGGLEMSRLLFAGAPKILRWLHFLMTLFIFTFCSHGNIEEKAVLFIILFAIANLLFTVVCLVLHEQFQDLKQLLLYIAKSYLGFGYILALPTFAAWILYTPNGVEWFFTMLLVVFACDIGAFIFGSAWGRTKLAPKLSPKKSLEGLIGGLVFSIGVALSCSLMLSHVPFMVFALLGFLGGLAGVGGDLFESLMKRVAEVKDSGTIMPGHGGILDRLDSVLFATPIFLAASLLYTF